MRLIRSISTQLQRAPKTSRSLCNIVAHLEEQASAEATWLVLKSPLNNTNGYIHRLCRRDLDQYATCTSGASVEVPSARGARPERCTASASLARSRSSSGA